MNCKLIRLARTIALLFLLSIGMAKVQAVPAYPGVLTMTQPDGTPIRVLLYGDERGHYYTSEYGEVLLETADGFRYAEIDAEGNIQEGPKVVPGKRMCADMRVQGQLLRKMQEKISSTPAKHPYVNKDFEPTENVRTEGSGMHLPSVPLPGLFPGSDFPTKGSPKVLVLMVEFLDVRFSSADAPETIRKQITQRHYKEREFTGSAYDYYCDASMEQFTPQFDVIGPIRVLGTQATYGANVNGETDANVRTMIIQACTLAGMQVDFSQYDNNHDGYVDNIYVIYAGRGEASGGGANTIWPHSWVIPDDMSPVINGVKLGSYACSNELMQYNGGLAIDGIGTFCHEFGHVLGLPDLYSTNYQAENHPGSWALMASGSYSNNSRTPPTLSAWERSALGWLKPIMLESGGDYTLPASLLTTNQAYVIPTRNANEYFTLENRQQYRGDWDDRVPSWGMLVWHIDYNANIWNMNAVNNNPYHQYANIVEARGDDLNNGYQMEDCFPTFGHNAFTDKTVPALKAWDGSLTDITLPSITEDSEWGDDDEDEPSYTVFFTAISHSGVSTIEAEGGVTFHSNGLQVEAQNAPVGTMMYLYSVDGRQVAYGLDRLTAPAPGLYIVKCGKATAKMMLQ